MNNMNLPESRILGNRYDKLDNNGLFVSDWEDTPSAVYFDVTNCVFMDRKYFQREDNIILKTWSDVFS